MHTGQGMYCICTLKWLLGTVTRFVSRTLVAVKLNWNWRCSLATAFIPASSWKTATMAHVTNCKYSWLNPQGTVGTSQLNTTYKWRKIYWRSRKQTLLISEWIPLCCTAAIHWMSAFPQLPRHTFMAWSQLTLKRQTFI